MQEVDLSVLKQLREGIKGGFDEERFGSRIGFANLKKWVICVGGVKGGRWRGGEEDGESLNPGFDEVQLRFVLDPWWRFPWHLNFTPVSTFMCSYQIPRGGACPPRPRGGSTCAGSAAGEEGGPCGRGGLAGAVLLVCVGGRVTSRSGPRISKCLPPLSHSLLCPPPRTVLRGHRGTC